MYNLNVHLYGFKMHAPARVFNPYTYVTIWN